MDRVAAPVTVQEVRAAAELAVRTSYGRLVAQLAARTGDLALAEDVLADALERALRTWPRTGVPDNPEGWLVTVARNRLVDVLRSAAHRTFAPLDAAVDRLAADPLAVDPDALPDRRLELMLVCAHPEVEAHVRTPLMLQVVLGLDARTIAAAFALPPATLAQRLVRAKRRIAAARVPFEVPDRRELASRLPSVLEAVYAAHATAPLGGTPLNEEARYLALVLATLLPDEPEVWGLPALLTFAGARASARGGTYLPLADQDPATWDAAMIAEGEALLRRAAAAGTIGRFQLEAAISSVHCDRARTGTTDWAALTRLYRALVRLTPTLGARTALAAAVGRAEGPSAGLAVLDAIDDPAAGRFQPAWATRAELTRDPAAYAKAISLTTDPAVRRWLTARAERL